MPPQTCDRHGKAAFKGLCVTFFCLRPTAYPLSSLVEEDDQPDGPTIQTCVECHIHNS